MTGQSSTTVPAPLAGDALARAAFDDCVAGFAQLRTLAERAVAQMTDDELHAALDDESNSVAVLLRHVGGNLRSRFADFLTTDGEKPDRDRDGEFASPAARTRAELLADWERGWATLRQSLDALTVADLGRTVTLRGEPMPAIVAIQRAQRHVAQHVGQIVLLAKHARGAAWQTLSIPRGASGAWAESERRRHGAA